MNESVIKPTKEKVWGFFPSFVFFFWKRGFGPSLKKCLVGIATEGFLDPGGGGGGGGNFFTFSNLKNKNLLNYKN